MPRGDGNVGIDVGGLAHGMHVAGIANRGTDRLKTVLVKLFAPMVRTQHIVNGLKYAIDQGARVINMSFGVERFRDDDASALVTQVKALIAANPDVMFVKAAGNEGRVLGQAPFTPDQDLSANVLPNLVTVAASDVDGAVVPYSNRGVPYTDVAMRGVNIFSTYPGEAYFPLAGTSMAAPNVAAVVGKLRTLCPTLTPEALKRILVATSDADARWTGLVNSGGVVNAERALRAAAWAELLRQGKSADAAAEHLGLGAEERTLFDSLQLSAL
jgi:subtilisin family serine protease